MPNYPPGWFPCVSVDPEPEEPTKGSDTLRPPDLKPPPSKTTHERLEAERKDGMKCSHCSEWYPMAEPNTSDYGKFVCWACRNDEFRPGTKRH